MKSYPSIDDKTIIENIKFHIFDKLDGSNIRAEWNHKQGFYKFGSRKRLINEKDWHLGKAVKLIKDKYARDLDLIFRRTKPIQLFQNGAVCFFEFFGPNSFAGQHEKDDKHDVVLFDVAPNKAGMLPPNLFIEMFNKKVEIAQLLHIGYVDEEIVTRVKNSDMPGMTFEGVVCKAPNPNGKKTSQPIMFKIKSDAWFTKLKEKFSNELVKELK